MKSLIERLVEKLINEGNHTKTIIEKLINEYDYTKSSANSLIKKVRQSLGIRNSVNLNKPSYYYSEDDVYDDDEFIGGKVHSTKKKKFKE